jgi:hypothetical protein
MKHLLLLSALLLQGCWVTVEREEATKITPVHHKQIRLQCGWSGFMGLNHRKQSFKKDNHELIIYTSRCIQV